jgi:hypothetical protein
VEVSGLVVSEQEKSITFPALPPKATVRAKKKAEERTTI